MGLRPTRARRKSDRTLGHLVASQSNHYRQHFQNGDSSKKNLNECDHRFGFGGRAGVVVLVRLEPSARRELSVRNTDRILAWLISSPARCPASAFTNSRLSRNLAISMLM